MGAGPGGVLSYYGASKSANAAGKAARAAERTAAANRQMIMDEGRRQQTAALDFAKASPNEIRAYEGSLSAAVRQNEQDMKLMDSIDPALMEASQQVLSLIRGEQSSAGGVFEKQRAQQRQSLVNQLRAKYGPGGEDSSLGRTALAQFDSQSAVGGAGVQQSSLSSLLGFLNQRPDMSRSSAFFTQAGQNFGSIQQRLTNAQLQTGSNLLSALSGANQAVQDTAGAKYVGAQLQGRALQQAGDQWQEADKENKELASSMAGMFMSDERLKTDIERMPIDYAPGIPQYKYRYKSPEKYGEGWFIGVMAQDLLEMDANHPAVIHDVDGFFAVDYDKLKEMCGIEA